MVQIKQLNSSTSCSIICSQNEIKTMQCTKWFYSFPQHLFLEQNFILDGSKKRCFVSILLCLGSFLCSQLGCIRFVCLFPSCLGLVQSVYFFSVSVITYIFFFFFFRSVGSASEAAKAGIPLNQYKDCSQVCTNFKHKISFLFIMFCEYYLAW